MANSYQKIGGIFGLVLVTSAFVVNLLPGAIAGQSILGSLDPTAILSYYNHPVFDGIFSYWALTSFYLIIFVLALGLTLKESSISSGTELWLLAAVAFAVIEAGLIIVQSSLLLMLVTISGTYVTAGTEAARSAMQVAALSFFRFWDVMWNSLLYWVEGGLLFFFSIVILKARTFARWVGWLGVAAGALQAFNGLVFWSSLAAALTFPGNLAFAVWLITVSVSLLRLKS